MNKISWTDKTWNPIVGCTKVSAGCANCWAERMARLHYWDEFKDGWDGFVHKFHERLEQPLHWRKPQRIAVGLMGDLFHEDVSNEFIDRVFATMADCPEHTFQILTKRPARMLAHLTEWESMAGRLMHGISPNWIWLGVSCEDQKTADERIPILLQTPAAVRFVSIEPMLGAVNLPEKALCPCSCYAGRPRNPHPDCAGQPTIDWVIVGGESGPGARPCRIEWIESVVAQCKAAGVPCHVKQLGAYPVWAGTETKPITHSHGKNDNPEEWPESLRVQEFPS